MMQDDRVEAWVAGVRSAYVASELVEPPDWVRANARRVFRSRRADASRPANDLAQRIRAVLVSDSRRSGLASAGVRSLAELDGPWQLLYRGGDVDVDLLVRPNQDGHTLNVWGQALSLAGQAGCAGVVQAHPSHASRHPNGSVPRSVSSEVEPSGEFALPNLERGHYDVVLQLGACQIELMDVEF